MNPYLDLAGFKLRTIMPSQDVDLVESFQPGFTVQRIASWSSEINAAARKRYGNAGNLGYHVPFGQIAPAVVAQGTLPPGITLVGRPVLGSMRIWIQIIVGGALGAATFAWSSDGGVTWFPNTPAAILAGAGVGIPTASTVALAGTGLTAQFAGNVGNYSPDNVYRTETPVPEVILMWLVTVVTIDLWMKRGTNPADPAITMQVDEKTRALARLKEAADGKDGLLDIPISEDLDSAVTTGGVESSSQASPYVWTDIEENLARREDCLFNGGYDGR